MDNIYNIKKIPTEIKLKINQNLYLTEVKKNTKWMRNINSRS